MRKCNAIGSEQTASGCCKRDRRHLQPARVSAADRRHRGVDGVQNEAEKRHGAADGEHEDDDHRKSRGAQLALLRRVQGDPVATRVGQRRNQTQVEQADDQKRNGVDENAVQSGVVDVLPSSVATHTYPHAGFFCRSRRESVTNQTHAIV